MFFFTHKQFVVILYLPKFDEPLWGWCGNIPLKLRQQNWSDALAHCVPKSSTVMVFTVWYIKTNGTSLQSGTISTIYPIPAITMTSQWAQWHLESPASNRLHNRLFIRAPRRWPLWGEAIGDRWIPLTKGQWLGKYFYLMTSLLLTLVTLCKGIPLSPVCYPHKGPMMRHFGVFHPLILNLCCTAE